MFEPLFVRRYGRSLVVLFALCWSVTGLGAPDIDRFQGQWFGMGVSETPGQTGPYEVRELDILIRTQDDQGFVLTSTMVALAPSLDQEELLRARTLDFHPSDNPNRWAAQTSCDSYMQDACAWARVDDNTLVVTTFALMADGRSETQTYRRTLIGQTMVLSFSRVVDGQIVRTVTGTLTKQ
jgi:hypothetical protein